MLKAYALRHIQTAFIAYQTGKATDAQKTIVEAYNADSSLSCDIRKQEQRLAIQGGEYILSCADEKAERQALHLIGVSSGTIPYPGKRIADRLIRFGCILTLKG